MEPQNIESDETTQDEMMVMKAPFSPVSKKNARGFKKIDWGIQLVFLFKVGDLGGGFKRFLFSPRKLGKISNLTDIFQMGWNHQLVMFLRILPW